MESNIYGALDPVLLLRSKPIHVLTLVAGDDGQLCCWKVPSSSSPNSILADLRSNVGKVVVGELMRPPDHN